MTKPHKQKPYSHFLAPKYWLTWINIGLIKLMGYSTLPIALSLGKCLGSLLYRVAKRRRHIAEVNLKLNAWICRSLPEEVFYAGRHCLQHAAALCGGPVSRTLDVMTPLFCIGKQFSGGLHNSQFADATYDYFNAKMKWIQDNS